MAGRIKGAALRETVLWLEKELGPARVRDAAQAMGSFRDAMSASLPALGVLSSQWYDGALVHGLFDAMFRGLTRAEISSLAYRATPVAVGASLGKFQRALLRRIASPALHRAFAQRLWDQHFDTGAVRVELPREGASIVRFSSWTTHHPFICDLCSASDIVIYEAMGLPNVRVRQLSCVDDKKSDCSHEVTWSS